MKVFLARMVDQVPQVQIMCLVVTIVATTQKSLKVLLATLVSLEEMACLAIQVIKAYLVKIISLKAPGDGLVVQVMSDPMDSEDLQIRMDFWQFFTPRLETYENFLEFQRYTFLDQRNSQLSN